MTSYLMQAVEDYDATDAAAFAALDFPAFGDLSATLIGLSYDAVRRTFIYSICWSDTNSISTPNTTGFTLWDGRTSIAAGANYNPQRFLNFDVMTLSVDTSVVSRHPGYDPDSIVPAGIGGGDGTWRRCIQSAVAFQQGPKVVDPWSGGIWSHHVTNCKLYNFRLEDSYALTISPYEATSDHSFQVYGVNEDWAVIGDFQLNTVDTWALVLCPRERTAAEITADQILGYAAYDFPFSSSATPWFGDPTTVFRLAVGNDGNVYCFALDATGSGWVYSLYKFTMPTSVPSPGAPVGGGWTDVTPWGSNEGPNMLGAAYSGGPQDNTLIRPLRIAGAVGLISGVYPGAKTVASSDVTDWKLQFGSYRESDGDYLFTGDFVTGYMTAGWVMTADPNAAAWAIRQNSTTADHALRANANDIMASGVHETNGYFDVTSYAFAGDEGALRLLYFEVNPVVDGVIDASTVTGVFAWYRFVHGAAPALARFIAADNWNAAYAAYGTMIGDPNVVQASQPDASDLGDNFNLINDPNTKDVGLYDAASDTLWWSGQNFNFYKFDDVFAARAPWNVSAPLLKLSFQSDRTQGHIF